MGRCKTSAIAGCVTSLQETWLLLIPKNCKTSQSFAQVAQEHSCCVCSCRLLGVIMVTLDLVSWYLPYEGGSCAF